MATRDRRDMDALRRDPYSSGGNYWLDPMSQFRRFAEQMDRWFDTMGMGRTNNRMSGMNDNPWAGNMATMWAPEMETFLRDDQFVIRMDLPGVNREDVNVEVTDDSVVIHGERTKTHEEDRDGYYRSERSYGRFYREVQLPEGAQPDSAKANYRDGVLEVTVTAPPRQVSRPRRVEIGASSTGEREERQQQRTPSASSDAMPISDRTSTRRTSVAHDRGLRDAGE